MKKLFSIVMCFALILVINTTSLAKEDTSLSTIINKFKNMSVDEVLEYSKKNAKHKMRINEYDMAVAIDNANNNNERVKQLKADALKLSSLSQVELTRKGYNESQINSVKTYDGSIELLKGVAGEVEIYLPQHYLKNNIEYKGRIMKTAFAITMSFEWVKPPLCKYTDIMALAWKTTDGSLIFDESNVNVAITREHITDGQHTEYNAYPVSIKVNDNLASVKFPVDLSTNEYPLDVVKKGYFNGILYNPDITNTAVQVSWAYGHSIFTIKPSASLSGSKFSISITPTTFVDTKCDVKTFFVE
ncbi:hypothetical protein [Vallitalea sp.]|jgi:hypothetical protein|uniref:hypothetical protein n=1 Tax=Vallitalea sp. TaxID=1882829 RepID=UPI0025FEDF2C|nr:hypothetical protein [Vallitalea sp.]MCT4686272.1 hypothetical protein [Vallitalea sp.]